MRSKKSLNRVLAVLLTVALLAGLLTVPAAAEAGTVVYVNNDPTNITTPEGAAVVDSLAAAYGKLDAEAGGTIVICSPVDFSLTGVSEMTGKVTLTSKYNDGTKVWDYTEKAELAISDTVELTGNTVIENVKITLKGNKSSASLFIYSGLDLEIKDGVTVVGNDATGDGKTSSGETATGRLKIFCGKQTGTENKTVNVSISSGEYFQVFMGINTKDYNTGTVNLKAAGNAVVTNSIVLGPNKGTSGDLNLTVEGEAHIENILNHPGTNDCTVGDVTVNLNSGTVGFMKQGQKTGNNIKSVTVNLTDDVKIGIVDDAFGNWSSQKVENGTTLNLVGFVGELPAGAASGYTTVNVSGNSAVKYAGALNSGLKTITVASGSSLELSAIEAAPDGVTVNANTDGYGTVTYKTATNPDPDPTALSVVYVNASTDITTRDGKTPGTAVATLADAYALLDKTAGGTVVICGQVTVSGTVDLESTAITGTVTITSKDSETDYRTANGAKLILKDSNTALALSDKTVIDHLNIELNAGSKKKLYIYSGLDLQIGSDVVVTPVTTPDSSNEHLRIYCGRLSNCGDVKVSIAGGTYNMIYAGAAEGLTVGNVDLTISGSADITSNVTMGGNASTTGNINFTMNGGEVKVIYATPGNKATSGTVTMNLNGGKIKSSGAMRDFNDAEEMKMGDVTVNLSGSFDYASGLFGVWSSNAFTDAPANKTLSLNNFSGKTLRSGVLENYTALAISDSSDVTYESSLPNGMKVTVAAGGVLRLTGMTREQAEAAGITATGNVVYAKAPREPLDTVYLDGSVTESGDGKTAATAVKTLAAAYDLLDTEKGGTIVICGPVTVTGLDFSGENSGITGTVTITSNDGTTDFQTEKGAKLTISGAGAGVAFGAKTVLENLTIEADGSGSQFIYAGNDLYIKESVSTTGNGTLKVFCAKTVASEGETIKVHISGGTYNQIFCGDNGVTTGDVELTIDGSTRVTSNVAMGPNKGKTGNIVFNMNGGYVKVIYDCGSANTTSGDVTINLNGGSMTEMRDYNNKSGITLGKVTVNYGPGFNRGSGKFGVWANGATKDPAVTKEYVVLNWLDYSGSDISGLTAYNAVNLFGTAAVPDGFDTTSGDLGHLLRVHAYTGSMDMDLSSYNNLRVTGESDATCMGEVPTSMAIYVEEGSVLRIRPSQNPGKSLDDYTVTGKGKVVFEEPPYSDPTPVLSVDFNNATASDASGKKNDGVITGSPAFGTGYDGSKAVYIENAFGENATQYVTFKDLNGIDLTKDDFTVTMWYKTVEGGVGEWAKASKATTVGSGINMPAVKQGGILLSNRDDSNTASSGFAAAQLPQNQFFTAGVTDTDGNHSDLDGVWQPQDGQWHYVALSVERAGKLSVYVDGALLAASDISGADGQALGSNSLALGADLLGQYGLGSAYVDELMVYGAALSQIDIQANYYIGRLEALTYEIGDRVASAGSEYTDAMKQAITQKNNAVIAKLEKLTAADYAQAMPLYDELKAAFDSFLMAPEDNANLVMLLISDIHIATEKDATAVNMGKIFADIESSGLRMDGIISAGDFADNSSPAAMNTAFDVFDSLMKNHTDWQMITSIGNHEVQYTNANENYTKSLPVYWQRLQAYISDDANVRAYGDGVVDDLFYLEDPENEHYHFDYGMTFDGYHILVLNTDYLKQTGNSKDVKDENGNYSIEGNELDPIRHGMYFEDETLEWVRKMLDEYSKDDLPIFVVEHFPFIDSCPLSYYREIVIDDNSIGKQDAELRSLLAEYDNVITFSGHLHSSMAMSGPVQVVAEDGSYFTQVNLPSPKSSNRGYLSTTASWIMYVYDDEIVLRARDFGTGEWLTAYDYVIPITSGACSHDKLVKVEAKAPTADAEGNIEYYICSSCGKLFTDETAAKEITLADTVLAKLGSNGSPNTGEAFPAGTMLCVMLLSGLALGAVLVDKKRRA